MKRYKFLHDVCALTGLLALGSMTACTDDHFDVDTSEPTSQNTIWQNVASNPKLTTLAKILPRIRFYSKEEDNTAKKMTYQEYLNSSQFLTLWAPIDADGSQDYFKSYLDQLDQIDKLRAEGKTQEANKLEYNVGVQFAQNHIARFNFESEQGPQEVRLLNAKITTYNAGEGKFNGVSLNDTYRNIPSSNGIIHVIDGVAPFSHNIFDYMEANSATFGEVYGTLSDPAIDKKTFNENLSIPGAMNENGQMVYVDSVYVSDNELLNNSGAQIKNEDSLYVAVIPTDAAWPEAYAKVKKLYNYKPKYKFDYAGTEPLKFNSTYNDLAANTQKGDMTKADSLADYNTRRALITAMYFSPSIFRGDFERDDTAGLVRYVRTADSLISTNGVIYHNPAAGQTDAENNAVSNPLFAGKYVKASNGIIFPLQTYDMSPVLSFMSSTKKSVNLIGGYSVGYVEGTSTGTTGTMVSLVEGRNMNPAIDLSMLDTKAYQYFAPTGPMTISIPLTGLYSGFYRIKVRILPTVADNDHKWYKRNSSEEVTPVVSFMAQLFDDEGNAIGGRDKNGEVTGLSTDRIYLDQDSVKYYTLWDKIEIPYSYAGLPDEVTKCYPILQFQMPRSYQNEHGKLGVSASGAYYGLSIYDIVIEPVEE